MKKILIGGSPCTHWSIAQKNNRETEPSGIGWELFNNFLIAKEKFKPDYFLYENNKSAAQPIKDKISEELGVPLQYINSALVSAQNRQRFYAHNIPNVPQPEDRGVLLRDILESGVIDKEKAYCLKHQAGNTRDCFKKHHTQIVAEPIRVGEWNNGTQGNRLYSIDGKSCVVRAVGSEMIIEPVRIGTIENEARNQGYDSKQYRVYSPDGKSTTICGQGGGVGAKTGLYACPVGETMIAEQIEDTKNLTTRIQNKLRDVARPLYEVHNGMITIKEKQYPIKLADGYYIIRKLTVTECCRLQTMPDDYCRAVSATQAYKGLGNGWTADVIIHILSHINIPKDDEIVVLSMYDGIGTGRYCFDKMGYTNVKYYAYEIDKYAKQVAMSNYPDIIQMGDAFQVREEWWSLPELNEKTNARRHERFERLMDEKFRKEENNEKCG